jgi:hypothetical protein
MLRRTKHARTHSASAASVASSVVSRAGSEADAENSDASFRLRRGKQAHAALSAVKRSRSAAGGGGADEALFADARQPLRERRATNHDEQSEGSQRSGSSYSRLSGAGGGASSSGASGYTLSYGGASSSAPRSLPSYAEEVSSEGRVEDGSSFTVAPPQREVFLPAWAEISSFRSPVDGLLDLTAACRGGTLRWVQRTPKGAFKMMKVRVADVRSATRATGDTDVVVDTNARPSTVRFGFPTQHKARRFVTLLCDAMRVN